MSHRPRRGAVRSLALFAAALSTALTGALTGSLSQGDAAQAASTAARPGAQELSFRVASFNVLGSNHTVGSRSWRTGRTRAKMARRWLEDERVTVAGLQEGQVDQLRTLTRTGRWESFPDARRSTNTETAQSVAWRHGAWRLVKAHTFRIPFDIDQVREQPVVQLRHRGTGRRIWVISVHFTAGGGAHGAKERKVGTRRLIAEVDALRRTRLPVLVTGDMNAHADFFCPFVASTDLAAATGGSSSQAAGCTPPSAMRVDWLFGSPAVRWEDFRFADGGMLDEITDHTVPVATVRLAGR